MAQVYTKVKLYLGRSFDFHNEIRLQDDGEGVYIAYWSDTVEKPKPTDVQLNSFESQANDIEALDEVYRKRQNEYPTIEECVHAILDDTLIDLQAKRQATKLKFPKE
jgi:hypothetical protein